jgi:GTPase SAR1 family protein
MIKADGEQSDVNYKIILVGNGKAGKTSLTHRIVFD